MGKKIGIAVGVIIAITLISCFVPIVKVEYWIERGNHTEIAYVEKVRNSDSELIASIYAFSHNPHEIKQALEGSSKEVPVGYVLVQNTDSVSTNSYDVTITFYSQGEKFSHNEIVLLSPGELETVKYYAWDIDANKDEWSWEYRVMPKEWMIQYRRVTLLNYFLHY